MFPLKKYYENCIKNEIIGHKREFAIKRLSNLLACHVISKNTPDVMHFRYFTCNEQYEPTENWLGTIAVKFKGGVVVETALSLPKKSEAQP